MISSTKATGGKDLYFLSRDTAKALLSPLLRTMSMTESGSMMSNQALGMKLKVQKNTLGFFAQVNSMGQVFL